MMAMMIVALMPVFNMQASSFESGELLDIVASRKRKAKKILYPILCKVVQQKDTPIVVAIPEKLSYLLNQKIVNSTIDNLVKEHQFLEYRNTDGTLFLKAYANETARCLYMICMSPQAIRDYSQEMLEKMGKLIVIKPDFLETVVVQKGVQSIHETTHDSVTGAVISEESKFGSEYIHKS